MRQISIKQKIIGVGGIILLGIVAVVLLVILPAVNKIRDLNLEIENTQNQIESNYSKAQLLRRSLQELETVQNRLQELNNATLDAGKELSFITILEDLAIKKGVDQTISLEVIETQPPRYIFHLSTKGPLPSVLEYISMLESLPTYLSINQVTLSRIGDASSDLVEFRADATIFQTQFAL